MGDQQEAVNEPTVETPETQDSTRPESNAPAETGEQPNESQDSQQAQPQTQEPTSQEGGETEGKKSRLERRVDKLVSKLKESGQPVNHADITSQLYGNEPLIRPEEFETGIDPNVLEQRLNNKRIADREQIKQELTQEAEYRAGINEHLADTESVKDKIGDNPEIDKLVAQQYEALNFLTDPRTGQTVFVPRVKMSEIYNTLEKVIDKTNIATAADITGKVVQQASEQAIPPSVSNVPRGDAEEQAAFERAKASGKPQDWAEVLKRRVPLKS